MQHAQLQDRRVRLLALVSAFIFSVAALQSASFGRLSASVGLEVTQQPGLVFLASQAPVSAMNRMMMVAPGPDAMWHGAAARHTMVQLDPSMDVMMELKALPDGIVGMRIHRAAADLDPSGFHAAAASSGWLDIITGVFDAR